MPEWSNIDTEPRAEVDASTTKLDFDESTGFRQAAIGKPFVVLETGSGLEVKSVALLSSEFSPQFKWNWERIMSMTAG